MERIKIFGERNSGTNYLEQLLIQNTCSQVLQLHVPKIIHFPLRKIEVFTDLLLRYQQSTHFGWKHGIPPVEAINMEKKGLKIITISKNPYSFLLSLHKRPYHSRSKVEKFEDFIKVPFRLLPRDNFSNNKAKNPIELWNEKNRSFLELKDKVTCQVAHLSYEELIADPRLTFEKICNSLQLDQNGTSFENIIQSTKDDETDFKYYQDYYMNEKWKSKLSKETILFINSFLDKDLMKKLDYEIIIPL